MEYNIQINNDSADVNISGKFTFSDHENFRSIIEKSKEKKVKSIVINMSGTEFVDSAALGMLLLLREHAEKEGISLTILKPSGQVKKMFEVSKFDQLFNIK